MTQFKVLSNRVADEEQGSTIDAQALEGANIQALIVGGHLAPVTKTTKTETDKTEDSKDK
jgi:hypothetical protein